MSNSTTLAAITPTEPGVEGRLIYPARNNLQLNRKDLVELVPPAHLYDDDDDVDVDGGGDDDYETDDRVIRKKNLRVGFVDQVQQGYDPWKDIYLRGNFDRQRSAGLRRKSDRKSVNYDYVEEKYDNDEYDYIEDEDLPSYNRRPLAGEKYGRRRKRPSASDLRKNKTKSGMGYYDYEDPSKYESSNKFGKDQLMLKQGKMVNRL